MGKDFWPSTSSIDRVVAADVRSEMHVGDRVYANEYHDLFVIRDGLIVHGREYFDTGKVAAFFGAQEGLA